MRLPLNEILEQIAVVESEVRRLRTLVLMLRRSLEKDKVTKKNA